jgi:hypothetical protein
MTDGAYPVNINPAITSHRHRESDAIFVSLGIQRVRDDDQSSRVILLMKASISFFTLNFT